MEIQIINNELLERLHLEAQYNGRMRQAFDLRTTQDDSSQRLLNVMELGTHVPIHRHIDTSETVICLEGCLDWVFYEELPSIDNGGPIHDGETAIDEHQFTEVARFRICPREKQYGIQVPKMTWHSVEVLEPSTILEAKDGTYKK